MLIVRRRRLRLHGSANVRTGEASCEASSRRGRQRGARITCPTRTSTTTNGSFTCVARRRARRRAAHARSSRAHHDIRANLFQQVLGGTGETKADAARSPRGATQGAGGGAVAPRPGGGLSGHMAHSEGEGGRETAQAHRGADTRHLGAAEAGGRGAQEDEARCYGAAAKGQAEPRACGGDGKGHGKHPSPRATDRGWVSRLGHVENSVSVGEVTPARSPSGVRASPSRGSCSCTHLPNIFT